MHCERSRHPPARPLLDIDSPSLKQEPIGECVCVRVYKTGYNPAVYSIQTTDVFETWFDRLRDRHAKARIQVRIDRAEDGNFGDCKSVGQAVWEMRIHHGAGYRVYYIRAGTEVVILLAGGDKSTQTSDIRTALKVARDLEA